MKLHRLRTAALSLTLLAAAPWSWAQGLVFAVNEGVTYRVSDDEIRARYVGIATDLGKILGQPVRVEPIAQYPVLRKGLTDKAYDLALVHPAHISIIAMKSSGYQLVAVTKGFQEYRASFLVRGDTTLKQLSDLRGRKLGAPDEDSITAWMVRATMRDVLGDPKAVAMTYTRYQDAVPFMVQQTFTQAAATASNSVVKKWEEGGGKVLGRSKAVPIKHVLAGPGINAAQLEKLRAYFIALDSTEDGRKKLEAIKVPGYAPFDTNELLALGTWLGL